MTQIVRVYDSSKAATEALAELKARGFEDVVVVGSSQSRGGQANSADIEGEIRRTGINPNYVQPYADRVKSGGALVSVKAPLGSGAKATEILNRHLPASPPPNYFVGDEAPEPGGPNIPSLTETPQRRRDGEAWRLSKALGIPELVRSNFFVTGFIPLLSDSQPFSSLSKNQKAFSSLSKNQSGHAKLSKNQKAFSSLSRNQRGRATLVNNPTPFSSAFALPVLVNDRRGRTG